MTETLDHPATAANLLTTRSTTFVPATFSKVSPEHLRLNAVLYVRQSTSQQLHDHQESTQRQYQLTHRLEAFGWHRDQIIVIDEDLGISGSGRQQRPGFQRLLNLVTEQKVGIVLGLEMSRLARNSKDWHDLFEVCAIYQVLIADEDGVFNTNDPNDRLVLGLKGIISEMELHTMKVRLERGRLYLLLNHADSAKQLNDPDLQEDQWRSEDLARELGIPEKQLKDWVTRGWLTAVQRPFGRTWVLDADEAELQRLKQLATRQSGQGSPGPPESLRTPTQKSRKPQ